MDGIICISIAMALDNCCISLGFGGEANLMYNTKRVLYGTEHHSYIDGKAVDQMELVKEIVRAYEQMLLVTVLNLQIT